MTDPKPLRLRRSRVIRDMVAETSVAPANLVFPFFVKRGGAAEDVLSPGIRRIPLPSLADTVGSLYEKGLRSVILFGIPDRKDVLGSEAYARDGVVQESVRALKAHFPDLIVATDVCLCQYTDHGHCRIIRGQRYDEAGTLEALSRIAVSHAEAGADVVAPSAMADNQVAAVRGALDREGFTETLIMSYSVKYASALYAPFREAAGSAPGFGDRSAYQMDFRNRREALAEASLDVEQGADIVMVKPALHYLDVVSEVKRHINRPVAAFHVSGEYAMAKLYARYAGLDERRVALEAIFSIRRAGADIIISYFTPQLLDWLKEEP